MGKDFLIAGGDKRMFASESRLKKAGCSVDRWSEAGDEYPVFRDYSCILFPVPSTLDGKRLNCAFEKKPYISDILACLHSGHTVLGGKLPTAFCTLAEQKGVRVFDYADDEVFQQQNAYLTAEGAIALAVEKTPFALLKSRCLVVGFGRIGKILADYLKAMGAEVQVAARHKDSLLLAKLCGFSPVCMENVSAEMGEADIVFNTVPEQILDLSLQKRDGYYMELASKPYGGGFETSLSEQRECVIVLCAFLLQHTKLLLPAGAILVAAPRTEKTVHRTVFLNRSRPTGVASGQAFMVLTGYREDGIIYTIVSSLKIV